MPKKRKTSGRPSAADSDTGAFRSKDVKLRINSYEDVADSEDEFHINRDKILLAEGPARKRQRKLQDESECSHISPSGNYWLKHFCRCIPRTIR